MSRHLRRFLEDNGMNDPSKVRTDHTIVHSTETATVKIFSDICLSLSQSRLPTGPEISL